MKDTVVRLASVDVRTVDNVISRKNIEVESKNGTCSLRPNIQVSLDWPGSLQLSLDEDGADSYVILFESGMETPHGIEVIVLLTDLLDNDVTIASVALAKASNLRIYADFPENGITFQLISPRGAIYGSHTIPFSTPRLHEFFEIKEGEEAEMNDEE